MTVDFQIDKDALDAAKSEIKEKLGNLADLSHDLANAISNVYYYKYLCAPTDYRELVFNIPARTRILLINLFVNKCLVGMIENIRKMKNEVGEQDYKFVCEAFKYNILYLDTLSVRDPMFITKIKAIFRKPFFDEIPYLVDKMNLYE